MTTAPAGTVNLVTADPSFELGDGGWNGSGGEITWITDTPKIGSHCIRWTSTSTSSSNTYRLTSNDFGIAYTLGDTTTLSVWVRCSEARNMDLYHVDGATNTHGPTISVPANTWTRLYVTADTNTSGITTRAYIYVDGYTTGMTIDVDCFMANTGSTLYDYFDGDTSGCSWVGVPYDSTSVYGDAPADDRIRAAYRGAQTRNDSTVDVAETQAGDTILLIDMGTYTSGEQVTAVTGLDATWTKLTPTTTASVIFGVWKGVTPTASASVRTITGTGPTLGTSARRVLLALVLTNTDDAALIYDGVVSSATSADQDTPSITPAVGDLVLGFGYSTSPGLAAKAQTPSGVWTLVAQIALFTTTRWVRYAYRIATTVTAHYVTSSRSGGGASGVTILAPAIAVEETTLPVKASNGTTFSDITGVHASDGSSWENAVAVHTSDGTTWS